MAFAGDASNSWPRVFVYVESQLKTPEGVTKSKVEDKERVQGRQLVSKSMRRLWCFRGAAGNDTYGNKSFLEFVCSSQLFVCGRIYVLVDVGVSVSRKLLQICGVTHHRPSLFLTFESDQI